MSTVEDKVYFGTVIFFNNKTGYGFIKWEKDDLAQPDIFAHYSDVVQEGYKTLKKDSKVSFKLGLNIRGQIKAVEITSL